MPSLSYVAEGKTVAVKIQRQELGGTYSLFADGESGGIPFGVTASLHVLGIEASYDIVDVSLANLVSVEAQITDGCNRDESPCDVEIQLKPEAKPVSPLDPQAYSFQVAFNTTGGQVAIGVAGEVFMPVDLDKMTSPVNWDQVLANPILLSQPGPIWPIEYHISHSSARYPEDYDERYPRQYPHNGDQLNLVSLLDSTGHPVETPPFDVLSPYEAVVAKVYDPRPGEAQDGTHNVAIALYLGKNLLGDPVYCESIHNNKVLVQEGQRVGAGALIGQLTFRYPLGGPSQTVLDLALNKSRKGWDVKWEDYGDYIDPKPSLLRLFLDELVVARRQPALLGYEGPEYSQLAEQVPDRRRTEKTELHERLFHELARANYKVIEVDNSTGVIVSPDGVDIPFRYFDFRSILLNPQAWVADR